MAPGTTDGHGEECPPHGLDLFIDHLHPQQFLVLQLVIVRAKRKKTGRHEPLILLSARSFRQQVASDLLENEFVERLVAIEGIDDVVPVTPSVPKHQAASATTALGEAGHIQPVPSPSLAKLRRTEQAIHQPRVRFR